MHISDEAIKDTSGSEAEQPTEKPAKAPRAPKAPKAAPESEAPAEKPAKARKAAKAEPAPEAAPEPAKARKGRKVPVAEASPTETPAEAAMRVTDEAAPATEPAKVRRLRGFVPRDPTVVCVIGLDTTHTARIASDEHPDAHPLYDERAHDEVSEADVDGADAVGESHDPVKIVRTVIAANTITPSYARLLDARDAVPGLKIDRRGKVLEPEWVEIEATVDGRHRVGAYRETNARRVRAGLDAVELRCELLKGLDDVRLLELRIATNNLRREDTTLGKARLARDLMDLKRVAYKERGEEAPAKHTMYKEIAPYFRVSDVAIRQWCDVLTRHPDVLAAVEAGTLSLTSAYKDFRGVPAEEQPAKLARILAGETRTAAASGDDFGGDAGSAPPGSDDSSSKDGEGSGEGDGSGDGEGDGAGVSAREDGGWKPDKRALNKVIAAQESKEIELPPHFVLGIRFALGHEINEAGVKGLKAALRDLKLRAD